MNSYESIVEKLDELQYFFEQNMDDESTETAQIACDAVASIETLLSEIAALQTALSRVEAERDVAKQDIESILRSCTCEVRHRFCVRCDEPGGCNSDDCHDAEWRGVQGEA